MTDNRDLPEDTGKAPPFAKPEPKLGEVGTTGGYSGQEYDAPGQAEWRDGDRQLGVSPDGEAHGSGSPGEEFERNTPGGQAAPQAGATPDREAGDSAQ